LQPDIERILSVLDDKIELNRRMSETLEALAQALFRDWFVDFGPVKAKMSGAAPYLAPSLWSLFPDRLDDDGVPDGWKVATLNDFVTCQNRKANPDEVDEGTPYIGLEHMPRRSIALSEWEGAEKVSSAKSWFRRREILFGKLRPYFHKVGIAPVDGICSTDIVVLAPKKQPFEALVLACVSTDEFVAFTDLSSTGTKMPRTSWKIMKTYPIVKPADSVADTFQAICGPMLDRILSNIEESHKLAQTRDLLLPKLMSGEICLGEAERELEEVR
jgi:type I restriction enzyme S subunit